MMYLRKLAALMTSKENGRYNESFKQRFKEIGTKAMEELAMILGLREYEVAFNPGGIGVSGDLRLMGMWSEENGVYIHMNKNFPVESWGNVLYRQIKHMKDYTGGPNNFFQFEVLKNKTLLKKKILALRKNYHEVIVESLRYGKASCTCGRWFFSERRRVSKDEIDEMFKKHVSEISD